MLNLEQFYALYPWLFAAAHASRSRLATYAVLCAPLAASFVCSLTVDTHGGPGFFLLQYRGWEVLIGTVVCHALVFSSDEGGTRENGHAPPERMRLNGSASDVGPRRRAFWAQLGFVVLVPLSLYLFLYPEHSRKATLCALAGTVSFFIAGLPPILCEGL